MKSVVIILIITATALVRTAYGNYIVTSRERPRVPACLLHYRCLLKFIYIYIHCTSGTPGGIQTYEANPDTKRLYDDLLANYNRLIRPVINNTETLTVWLGLKLSQLIEMVKYLLIAYWYLLRVFTGRAKSARTRV